MSYVYPWYIHNDWLKEPTPEQRREIQRLYRKYKEAEKLRKERKKNIDLGKLFRGEYLRNERP